MKYALAGIALLGLTACPAEKPSVRHAAGKGHAFFPLHAGNWWKYSVTTGRGDGKDPEIKQVTHTITKMSAGPDGETRYRIKPTGPEPEPRYYVRQGKLVGRSDTVGVWSVFLDGDLNVKSVWPAALVSTEFLPDKVSGGEYYPGMAAEPSSGRKALTSVSETVTVPAGTFKDCLKVEHTRGRFYGVKVFARGIGVVRSELYWVMDDGTRAPVQIQNLVEYNVEEKKEK